MCATSSCMRTCVLVSLSTGSQAFIECQVTTLLSALKDMISVSMKIYEEKS